MAAKLPERDIDHQVTIVVPPALVDAVIGLVEAARALVEIDQGLDATESDGQVDVDSPAWREIRRACRAPLDALSAAWAAMAPEKLGALSGKNAELARDVMFGGGMGAGGIVFFGRAAAARLAAEKGVKGAAEAVEKLGQKVAGGATRAATVVASQAARAGLPEAGRLALREALVKVGTFVGGALGILIALKIAGSDTARSAIKEALPAIGLIVGLYLLSKRKE